MTPPFNSEKILEPSQLSRNAQESVLKRLPHELQELLLDSSPERPRSIADRARRLFFQSLSEPETSSVPAVGPAWLEVVESVRNAILGSIEDDVFLYLETEAGVRFIQEVADELLLNAWMCTRHQKRWLEMLPYVGDNPGLLADLFMNEVDLVKHQVMPQPITPGSVVEETLERSLVHLQGYQAHFEAHAAHLERILAGDEAS